MWFAISLRFWVFLTVLFGATAAATASPDITEELTKARDLRFAITLDRADVGQAEHELDALVDLLWRELKRRTSNRLKEARLNPNIAIAIHATVPSPAAGDAVGPLVVALSRKAGASELSAERGLIFSARAHIAYESALASNAPHERPPEPTAEMRRRLDSARDLWRQMQVAGRDRLGVGASDAQIADWVVREELARRIPAGTSEYAVGWWLGQHLIDTRGMAWSRDRHAEELVIARRVATPSRVFVESLSPFSVIGKRMDRREAFTPAQLAEQLSTQLDSLAAR